jgi:hypothetical protein
MFSLHRARCPKLFIIDYVNDALSITARDPTERLLEITSTLSSSLNDQPALGVLRSRLVPRIIPMEQGWSARRMQEFIPNLTAGISEKNNILIPRQRQ